jgi:hypothetical protein
MYIHIYNVDSSRSRTDSSQSVRNWLKPVVELYMTAANQLCVVRSSFDHNLNVVEPVAVPVPFQNERKKGPNQTFKH